MLLMLKTRTSAWPLPKTDNHNSFWKPQYIYKTPTEQAVVFLGVVGGDGDQFPSRYSVWDIPGSNPDLLGATSISSVTFFLSLPFFFPSLFSKSGLVTSRWKFNSFYKIFTPVPINNTFYLGPIEEGFIDPWRKY